MYLSSYTGQLREKLYTCIVNEGDKTMDYNDVIRNKNRILAITLLICIVLRCIVNAFFTGIVQVIPMGIGGLIFTALLFTLEQKGTSGGHDVCHGGTHVGDQYHSDDSLSLHDQLSDVFLVDLFCCDL